MADNPLPFIGVEAVVKNSKEYFNTLENIGKKTSSTYGNIEKSTKGLGAGSKVLKNIIGNLDEMTSSIVSLLGVGEVFAANIGKWTQELVASLGPMSAVIASVIAITAAIVVLGKRGAEVSDIRNAFYSLNAQFGIMADDTLVKLRAGANGTISDFNLMRTANLALAGSTDAVGQAYLQNFDKILQIAQVQARATGQSTEFLFDSLIRGIKRASPMLIDNTGLIVNETEANKKYAESIGVAVESLTEEQKQLALLQATLEAGDKAIAAAGGVQLTTTMKIQQMAVTLQNTFDRAALAVKPLFDLIVDGLQWVLSVITPIVNFIIDIIGFLSKHIANAIRALVSFLQWLFAPIFNYIGEIFRTISENIDEWAKGAGRTMAAYANGILHGLTTYVMPAILTVAHAIASLLIGQSPPPEGPLSEIFSGGAAVMDAWVQGFVSSSLQPVSQAAQDVANLMGGVASMSLGTVEKQLKKLEQYLAPFENRVGLLEARFKALDDVVQGAFKSIDQQQARLLERLNAGDQAAADQIRALDVEREKYQDILDIQGAVVDDAKLQLSMAKATVSAQMTALEIRKKQLEAQKKVTEATKATTKAAESKGGAAPKPAGGGGGDKPVESPGFGEIAIPGESAETDWLGIDALAANVQAGFGEVFDSSQANLLGEQFAELGDVWNSITPDAIGKNFTNMFTGFGKTIQTNLVNPIQEKVQDAIDFLIGEEEGSMRYGISQFISGIPDYFANLSTEINTWFTNTWRNAMTSVNNLLTATDLPGSLANNIFSLGTNIIEWLVDLPGALTTALGTPFETIGTTIYDTIFNRDLETSLASRFFNFFMGPVSQEGTLSYILQQGLNVIQNFPLSVSTALQGMGMIIWNAFAVPIIGSLQWIIDRINDFIGQVNLTIGDTAEWVLSVTGIDFTGLSIPTLDVNLSAEPPAFLAGATGQARGGMTKGPGAVKVNERGQEGFVLGGATQMMTFPSEFLSTLTDIRNILVSAVTVPMASASSTSTSNVSNVYNFNNSRSADDSRRTAAMMRIFKK